MVSNVSDPVEHCDGTVNVGGVGARGAHHRDGSDDVSDGKGGDVSLGHTLRRSSSFGVTASFGGDVSATVAALGANASIGGSSNYTDQEYMDWNGDGLPDRVAPAEIFLSGVLKSHLFVLCIKKVISIKPARSHTHDEVHLKSA